MAELKEGKQLNLEVAERLMAIQLLNQWQGNIENRLAVLKDAEVVGIQAEEAERIGLKKAEDGKSIVWNPESPSSEVAISRVSVDFLVKKIGELSDEGKIGLSDGPLVALYEKLQAE